MLQPIFGCAAWCVLAAAGTGDVPPERLAVLARGVNVSHWFWLARDPSAESRAAFVTALDVDQLKAAGLTHVRIPLEPSFLWDDAAGRVHEEHLAEYRRAIGLLVERGMGVVVDPHPNQSPWAQPRAGADFVAKYSGFWAALAAALSDTDPGLVFLEVVNEPHDFKDSRDWAASQATIVAAMRAGAPAHTIIATGDQWGSIDGLLALQPVDDPNVAYSFHFYEPHSFTHQGASWGSPNWKNLERIPYPVDPEIAAPILPTLNEKGRNELRWYAEQRWNAGKVRERIGKAAAWAKDHGVPVYCGEFGAYRAKTPEADRGRWLSDVRTALGEHGIGWCVWDYTGGFALVEGEAGKRTVHADASRALGLNASR